MSRLSKVRAHTAQMPRHTQADAYTHTHTHTDRHDGMHYYAAFASGNKSSETNLTP